MQSNNGYYRDMRIYTVEEEKGQIISYIQANKYKETMEREIMGGTE